MFLDQFNALKTKDFTEENEYNDSLYSNTTANPNLENNYYQDINNLPNESLSKTIDYRHKASTNEVNCKLFIFIK